MDQPTSRKVDPPTKQTMGAFILTLDVGTSSLRAMLFDETAAEVTGAETQIQHSVYVTPDGGAELDPAMLFENACRAIDATLAHLPAGATIAAVATSTLWHSVLGVDAGGTLVTPLYTWADTRAAGAAAELRRRLDQDAVHARTGCLLHPSYLPARLLWLRQRHPELWRRVALWLSFGEYMRLRLFGSTLCSLSMASGTGLLDVHACTWDAEVLAAVGLDVARLAPLGDVGDSAKGLGGAWARRWPALAQVPWFPALGDGACSNVGSGCTTPGRIALMVGTSGATRVITAAPDATVQPGVFCYRLDHLRLLLGGALSEGGSVTAWLRATLRLDDLSKLDAELAALPPDGHGLTMLPLLAGERSPGWAATARGAIDGLTLATRPIEILRASYEAIAYRFALIHRQLAAVADPRALVIASGGALLGSPVWMGIMADVLGRPVAASGVREASSRGAALLALEALGLLTPLDRTPDLLGEVFTPDPGRHAIYLKALERQERLYGLLVKPQGRPDHTA